MNAYDASEQAYKRGYEAGRKDIRNKLQGFTYENGELVYVMVKDEECAVPFKKARFGRWVKLGKHDWACSVCKRGVPYTHTGFHYCYHCGADMRGEEDG